MNRNIFSRCFLLALVLLTCSTAWAENSEKDEALAVFAEYVRLAETFDLGITNLYDDEAVISATLHSPNGTVQQLQFKGDQYKNILPQIMPTAKMNDDQSTFKVTNVEIVPEGIKIHADRYSKLKCYTDSSFFIVIRKNQNGKYVIFKEHSEVKSVSEC